MEIAKKFTNRLFHLSTAERGDAGTQIDAEVLALVTIYAAVTLQRPWLFVLGAVGELSALVSAQGAFGHRAVLWRPLRTS